MKKLLFIAIASILLTSCLQGEDDPQPQITTIVIEDTTNVNQEDDTTLVKFTLYSNRVPYIWKRVVNGAWVQDSIKTNNVVVYEPYDTRNMGVGYFVTMNLSGRPTDSLHIKAEYGLKVSEMSSVKGQSFAFVKLDDLK